MKYPFTDTKFFLVWVFYRDGKTELKAVLGELLHNAGEWKAEEESTASQPRESSTPIWAETEVYQGKQQQSKSQ